MDAEASYIAIVKSTDRSTDVAIDQLVNSTAWDVDRDATQLTPEGLTVLSRQEPVSELSPRQGFQEAGADLRSELASYNLHPDLYLNLISSGQVFGQIPSIFGSPIGPGLIPIPSAPEPAPVPVPKPPPGSTDGAAKTNGASADSDDSKDAKKPEEEKPAPLPDAAAVLAAALAGLDSPAGLWEHLEKSERQRLAQELIPKLYGERSGLARHGDWVVAPELALLERVPGEEGALAKKLLKVKCQLTEADARRREAGADLIEQQVMLSEQGVLLAAEDVQMARQRVRLAHTGVAIAGEGLEQMKKWRQLAKWAPWFLLVTTLFAMGAIAWTLGWSDASDAAVPVIIFVLALFAISPAVLLLNERPLEGLDKWSPGGAPDPASTGDGSDSVDPPSATTPDSASASPPAAPTTSS